MRKSLKMKVRYYNYMVQRCFLIELPDFIAEQSSLVEPLASIHDPHDVPRSMCVENENEGDWETFLRRAEERGRKSPFDYDNEPRSGLEGWEQLWEIGCKVRHFLFFYWSSTSKNSQVGCEEDVVFKALSRATHPRTPDNSVKAVIAQPSYPGRVFIETVSMSSARTFAVPITELNANTIRIVPREDMTSVLWIRNPFSFDGKNWARISGRGRGWGIYKGDIGMVAEHKGNKVIIAIPRIKTMVSDDRQRPQQSLFPAYTLKTIFGEDSIVSSTPDGMFTFEEETYTKEGFLYCFMNQVELCKPADELPTQKELETFQKCSLIGGDVFTKTSSRLAQMKITTGIRVVIIQGKFQGSIGRVIEVSANEVAIFIESLDRVEHLLKSAVRTAFHIGDQVQICSGNYGGDVGWVVDIQESTVTIVNVEKDLEVRAFSGNSHYSAKKNNDQVCIQKGDVELYSSPFVTTLRKQTEDIPLPRGQDPNKAYHEKRIIIVGETHYKSYKGIVKNTNLDGYAWVQLEARQQETVKIPISQIALLSVGTDRYVYMILTSMKGRRMKIPSKEVIQAKRNQL